ncbi:unnamed protein product, partial [Heterobilharzia americana]
MMRYSIRRKPFVCGTSCSHSTHYGLYKKPCSSEVSICSKKRVAMNNKMSVNTSLIDNNTKCEVPEQCNPYVCKLNNVINGSSDSGSVNSDPTQAIKPMPLNSVNTRIRSTLESEHFHDSSDRSLFFDLLNRLEEHLDQERKTNAKLRAELMDKSEYEKQISDIRASYEAEVFRLQNVITRLQENSECPQKKDHDGEKPTESAEINQLITVHNNVNDDTRKTNRNKCVNDFTDLEELKKEYTNQELLISGYQRENEKLYAYIKNSRKDSVTETQDSKTAKRLTNENLSLRVEVEQLNKELRLRSQQICNMLSGSTRLNQENRINQLEDLIKQLQSEKDKIGKDLDATRSELINTNSKLNNLEREKNDLLTKYESFKQKSQADYESMKQHYESRVEELEKKLRWYVENQAMINRDTKKLQIQARELEKLQSELSHLKTKHASYFVLSESKQSGDQKLSNETEESFLLERIKFLENELERAHENEKRAIRSLQQQYERVKLQYEDRIKSLETYANLTNAHNSTCSSTSNSKNCQPSLNTQALTNNKSTQIINEDLVETRKSQSIMISSLLDSLRNQITHLKVQLNERQKTIEEMKHFAEINSNNNMNNDKLNRNTKQRSKFPIINNRFHHPHVHEIKSRQINFINDQTRPKNACKLQITTELKNEDECNTKETISLKEHHAVKSSFQTRIN